MIAFLTDLSVIFLQLLILRKHSLPYPPHSLQQFNYSSQRFHFHLKKSTVMFIHYTVQGKVSYQPFINTIPLEWQNIILNIPFTRILFACLDCTGMTSDNTEKLIIAWKIFTESKNNSTCKYCRSTLYLQLPVLPAPLQSGRHGWPTSAMTRSSTLPPERGSAVTGDSCLWTGWPRVPHTHTMAQQQWCYRLSLYIKERNKSVNRVRSRMNMKSHLRSSMEKSAM